MSKKTVTRYEIQWNNVLKTLLSILFVAIVITNVLFIHFFIVKKHENFCIWEEQDWETRGETAGSLLAILYSVIAITTISMSTCMTWSVYDYKKDDKLFHFVLASLFPVTSSVVLVPISLTRNNRSCVESEFPTLFYTGLLLASLPLIPVAGFILYAMYHVIKYVVTFIADMPNYYIKKVETIEIV